MKILLDHNVLKELRAYLAPHEVFTTRECGWAGLVNGALLRQAEAKFDVLLTIDSNLTSQQNIAKHRIALIVLRAFRNKIEKFLPLVPEILATLNTIQAGQAIYLYADEHLRRRDERKGKRQHH